MPHLKVVKPGLQTTIQDAGRLGYEHLGIMVGGWLDDYAGRWANRLLHNALGEAVLEMTLVGPELVAEDEGWLALTGADFGAMVAGQPWLPGSTWYVHARDRIRFGVAKNGVRGYLAGAGGILGDQVLGSCSTDLTAQFGGMHGRALQTGDVVEYGGGPGTLVSAPVNTVVVDKGLRVLPGSHRNRIPSEVWERLIHGSFRVNSRSDRVGIRLDGEKPPYTISASESISEGMAIGSIQAPPSGELLILTKSRGSIGGYPTLGHVITADWPILAQLRPRDVVTFITVDAEQAHNVLLEREKLLSLPLVAVR